jgi:N-acetylneuraminic acid mutarotase
MDSILVNRALITYTQSAGIKGGGAGDFAHTYPFTLSIQGPERNMSDGLRVLEFKTWKEGKSAPRDVLRGSAVAHGPVIYCSTTGGKTVFAYDSRSSKWSTLPECPQQFFALVIVGDTLVAVGGFRGLSPTGALQSLTSASEESGTQSWVETLPQMPTKRGRIAALCSGRHLIAAGGQLAVVGGRLGPGVTIRTPSPDMDESEESGYVKRVEMLDTESEQWYTLASLPKASTDLSLSLCRGHLYLLGGWSSKDRTKSVLTCHLQSLLRTATISLGSPTTASAARSSSLDVWQRTADVPAYGTTSAVLFDTVLVAVGGFDDSETPTDEVYSYEPSNDSWHVVGHMSMARYQAVTATLPSNNLMVVGGYNAEYKSTNHVEIGSV